MYDLYSVQYGLCPGTNLCPVTMHWKSLLLLVLLLLHADVDFICLALFAALIATFGDVNAAIDRLLQQRQR